MDTAAFGCWWPGEPSHAHTRHTRLDLPQVQEKGKGRQRKNVWSSLFLREYGFLCNVCIKGRVGSCQGCRTKLIFLTQH